MTIDSSLQRHNMLESQVRPSDITDRRILRAMGEVPREAFVPASRRAVAYMDGPIVLTSSDGMSRELLAPRTLAKLMQLCDLDEKSVVLDVGCTTGYSTAVLARFIRRVIGLEADAAMAGQATKVLKEQGVANAVVVAAAMPEGRQSDGPYDAILINGAIETEPAVLLDQLKDRGRLVAISGGPARKALVWTRIGRAYDCREDFDVAAATLPGFAAPKRFTF